MLGDTAVAVHPDDARYKHLIGKTVDAAARPAARSRSSPTPMLVDPTFGTGCVKVTPAHDPNDYQAGLRNKLPMINILNPDGTLNENAGKYAGPGPLRGPRSGGRPTWRRSACSRGVEDRDDPAEALATAARRRSSRTCRTSGS